MWYLHREGGLACLSACKFIADGRVTEAPEGFSEEDENAELPALTFQVHWDTQTTCESCHCLQSGWCAHRLRHKGFCLSESRGGRPQYHSGGLQWLCFAQHYVKWLRPVLESVAIKILNGFACGTKNTKCLKRGSKRFGFLAYFSYYLQVPLSLVTL